MSMIRTKDTYGKHLSDFNQVIYIVCPSCEDQAIAIKMDSGQINPEEASPRLTCTKCGYHKIFDKQSAVAFNKVLSKKTVRRYKLASGVVDPYFLQPLWLKIDCCSTILWAYNYEHLLFIERHVAARLRERNSQKVANGTLGSRLPKWMTSKNNRENVLGAIVKLKGMSGTHS